MKSGFLLFLAFTAIAFAQTSAPAAAPSVLKSDNGRFVFGQIGPARADQFLLDTQTGRLWEIVVNKEGQQKLQPVPYIQLAGYDAFTPDSPADVEQLRAMAKQLAMEEYAKKMEAEKKSKETKP